MTVEGRLEFRPSTSGDQAGHGTACAGIIAGVAPDVELYSVKVLGPQGSGSGETEEVIRAIAADAASQTEYGLLQKTITKCGAENMSATSDARNWMHAPTGADYQYDAAGNMTYDASGQYYSYDQENRITGAGGYTYTYDADGNRVKKSNGSTGTLYWYMAPGIVAESDLSGALQS